MKSLGYIIYDETWKRLVFWLDETGHQPAALWNSSPRGKNSGPTLFPTKKAARKAISETRKLKPYAWASNNYVIYEVQK